MKKFIIDKKVFDRYNDLIVGVLICKNIDNTNSITNIDDKFLEIKNSVVEKFQNIELADYPVVKKWRDIYKSFGEKKARSSIEALIRRIVNGKDISNINPLVDIYNFVSLKYEVPCGGEDLDSISSDMFLTYADGEEEFISLGQEVIEHPNVGEVVYKTDNIIICRNFNYRESDVTKLTENTRNAVLIIESFSGYNDGNLLKALNELSEIIIDNLGGTIRTVILDEQNNEVEL